MPRHRTKKHATGEYLKFILGALQLKKEGVTAKKVAADHEISVTTLYKWREKYGHHLTAGKDKQG
jgi:hypothetical protein